MKAKNVFSFTAIAFALFFFSITFVNAQTNNAYFTNTEQGIQTGGIKIIPINKPKGTFNVWTKRIGNNPTMKVLILHGGPGGSHDGYECFESFLPKEGIEFIYYVVIGATHDTMDPKYMKWMSQQMPKGQFLLCANGSHCSFYDDQQTYFTGLIQFIKKVNRQ